MKILLLTYEYPPQKGGIATYLSNLVKSAPAEVEVVVDVPRPGEHWIMTGYRQYFKVRKEKPDLIMISHVLPAGYVAWKIKTWFKTPFIVFTHGTDILSARKMPWKHFWMRFILRRAKFVVANSRFTASLLKEEGVTKIEIIPPGVPIPPRPVLAPACANTVISIGRLIERKGFDTLIKAMPAVIKEIPDVHLKIVGHGGYYDELVRLAHEERIEKFVEILTDVSDVNDELARSAIFVLAAKQVGSDIEGFGIVTLEASAVGLPVIVTNSGGAAEPVVDGVTGFVVNTDNIAGTIIRLLKNPVEAAKLGAAGRDYATKEYSIEAIGKKFWSIIM